MESRIRRTVYVGLFTLRWGKTVMYRTVRQQFVRMLRATLFRKCGNSKELRRYKIANAQIFRNHGTDDKWAIFACNAPSD